MQQVYHAMNLMVVGQVKRRKGHINYVVKSVDKVFKMVSVKILAMVMWLNADHVANLCPIMIVLPNQMRKTIKLIYLHLLRKRIYYGV